MNLNELLRKIEFSTGTIWIDSLYRVFNGYIDEDDVLHLEAYRNGELTIFSVDSIDNDGLDGTMWVRGGDEVFAIEFVTN